MAAGAANREAKAREIENILTLSEHHRELWQDVAKRPDWAEVIVQQRGPISTRVLHGLLALAQKHPVKELEAAAQKALHHGTWRLRDLRTLLEQSVPSPQLDFLETHPLIRNLATYRDCVPDCFTTSTINQT